MLAVEALQIGVLVGVALALGWDPSWSPLAAVAVVLGTVAFAGLGLLMAGTLKAETTLAAANGLYLVLLLLGGMVVPIGELPAVLRVIADALPAAALADAIRGSLTPHDSVEARSWLVLAAWTVVAPAAAARWFRWE